MTALEVRITIDVDDAPVSGVYARPDGASATIIVAHGAGAGMEHPFLSGFTRALNDDGFATLRFNFAYREAGRRFADRPPAAIAAWRAATDAATARAADAGSPDEPIWATGKSFGGRMASMAVADGMPAAGLVFLGYPLHAPGKPDKPRDEHLPGIDVPMLFLQGTNDPFAIPNEQLDEVARRIGSNAEVQWIEGGGHSFEVKGAKRPAAEIGASLAAPTAVFVRGHSPDESRRRGTTGRGAAGRGAPPRATGIETNPPVE